MNSFLVILLIIGFIWLTTRDLKWRFGAGIVAGILLIAFQNNTSSPEDTACLGAVLIVGSGVWLLVSNSMAKNNSKIKK